MAPPEKHEMAEEAGDQSSLIDDKLKVEMKPVNGKTTDNSSNNALVNGKHEKGSSGERHGLLLEESTQPPMMNPPVDKFKAVYFIFLIHGIATLMPWNMFITALAYFSDYKLGSPNTPSSSNSTHNATLADSEGQMYSQYFLNYIGFAAQTPNVLLNFLSVFCRCGGGGRSNIGTRIVWSILIVVVIFIITVVLAIVDSSQWKSEFFWITMATVVISNSANGVYQNSVYGLAAGLPMKYTNAVVLGSNLSGVMASVLSIISIMSSPNLRTAAVYYFLAAVLVLLVAFDTYFVLPFIPFYRYYKALEAGDSKSDEKEEDPVSYKDYLRKLLQIFKMCWVQHLSVFFVFFVTLGCFPAIIGKVKQVGDIPLSDVLFGQITCFLTFNLLAMLGNLSTEFVTKPGPKWVWIPVLLRIGFFPYFALCNVAPDTRRSGLPVLIHSDIGYLIGNIVFAFSSGYLSSLAMMYAPGCVKKPEDKGLAGMMAAFFLIFGIFSGVAFSYLVMIMITQ